MKRNNFASLAVLAAALAFGVAHAGGLNLGNTTNDNRDYSTTNQGGKGGDASAKSAAVGVGIAGAASTSNAVSGGNSLGVVVQGDQNPVASAIATGLVAANGTCMGSTSAGAQGVTVGLSIGTTWVDGGCDARYDSAALAAIGQPGAALARLCQRPDIKAAIEATGQACPSRKPADKLAGGNGGLQAPAVSTAAYTGSDPIVMKRLGLTK